MLARLQPIAALTAFAAALLPTAAIFIVRRRPPRSSHDQSPSPIVGRDVCAVGHFFEPLAVKNDNVSTPSSDQRSALEFFNGNRHSGTANAQHHRQEFVRQSQFVAVDAVVGHQ